MVAMSRQKNTVIEIQVFKLLFFYVKDILGRKKKRFDQLQVYM